MRIAGERSDARDLVRLRDDPERRQRIGGVHGREGAVAQRRGDAGVEAGVVASLRGYARGRWIGAFDAERAPAAPPG